MASDKHFTTRRGFIAAMGFGGVSLYGLWAAYGAAPGPLALLGMGQHGNHVEGEAGHAAHKGHGAASGPGVEEFNRLNATFMEHYRLPDGTVHPRQMALMPGAAEGVIDHGAMDQGAMDQGAMDHSTMAHGSMAHNAIEQESTAPQQEVLDVYLAAGMWYYQPNKLRLDVGQPYRFRMMAVDVSHGASIQFGQGGRIVRLRPGRLTEMAITFNEPGKYLVYCTVFCGAAHDVMQATLEVV
ncbi:hypothetical protein [Nitrincola sp. MINF-07-Sa-05]|uniref:hypothetical protein n=1 Tax=Nitrincola salilacus TaxID=3400273 RepID=UPI0039185ED9